MQSNIKDFVWNYFEHLPKTTSFMQLKKVLQKSEGLQTMHSREIQRLEEMLRDADERRSVWEDPDAEDPDAASMSKASLGVLGVGVTPKASLGVLGVGVMPQASLGVLDVAVMPPWPACAPVNAPAAVRSPLRLWP